MWNGPVILYVNYRVSCGADIKRLKSLSSYMSIIAKVLAICLGENHSNAFRSVSIYSQAYLDLIVSLFIPYIPNGMCQLPLSYPAGANRP
jgi:hypothetical protein